MRSVRLGDDLDTRVRLAAERAGESVSEFLRRAARARADVVLAESPSGAFDDVIGAVHSDGNRARRTGDAFTEVLRQPRTTTR